jgi:hypothetical protein
MFLRRWLLGLLVLVAVVQRSDAHQKWTSAHPHFNKADIAKGFKELAIYGVILPKRRSRSPTQTPTMPPTLRPTQTPTLSAAALLDQLAGDAKTGAPTPAPTASPTTTAEKMISKLVHPEFRNQHIAPAVSKKMSKFVTKYYSKQRALGLHDDLSEKVCIPMIKRLVAVHPHGNWACDDMMKGMCACTCQLAKKHLFKFLLVAASYGMPPTPEPTQAPTKRPTRNPTPITPTMSPTPRPTTASPTPVQTTVAPTPSSWSICKLSDGMNTLDGTEHTFRTRGAFDKNYEWHKATVTRRVGLDWSGNRTGESAVGHTVNCGCICGFGSVKGPANITCTKACADDPTGNMPIVVRVSVL